MRAEILSDRFTRMFMRLISEVPTPRQFLLSVGDELQAPSAISQSWEQTNPRVCSAWVGSRVYNCSLSGLQSDGFQVFFSFQVHFYPPFSQSISSSCYFTLQCFLPFSIFYHSFQKTKSPIMIFLTPCSMEPEIPRKLSK